MIDSNTLKNLIINNFSNYNLKTEYNNKKIIPPNQTENFLEILADVFAFKSIDYLKQSVVTLSASGNSGTPGTGIAPISLSSSFLNLYNPNFSALNWTGDQAPDFVKAFWEIFYNYISSNAQIEIRITDNTIGVAVGTAIVSSIVFNKSGFITDMKNTISSRLNIQLRDEFSSFLDNTGNYENGFVLSILSTIPIVGGTPVSPTVPVSGFILGHIV